MNKIPADISTFIQPLISKDFNEVVDLANKMVNMDIASLQDLRSMIIKLAGYLFFASTLAGYYGAERRKVQYQAVINGDGTTVDKEARGKVAAADLHSKELIFENMRDSIKQMVDGLKKAYEIKVTEFEKRGEQNG